MATRANFQATRANFQATRDNRKANPQGGLNDKWERKGLPAAPLLRGGKQYSRPNRMQQTFNGAPRTTQRQTARGTAHAINEEGGWHTVGPRKVRGLRAPQGHVRGYSNQSRNNSGKTAGQKKSFKSEETEKAFAQAFNERRCFRCLAKDHKRSECREPMRCFKCNKLGHTIGRCVFKEDKQPIKEVKEQPRTPTIVSPDITFAHIVQKGKEKAEEQPKMEPFWDERPEEVQIFLPQRQVLAPQTEQLHRTGMVVMIQGQPTPDIPRILARRLVQEVGWQPRDYEIMAGNEEDQEAPFLVTCLGENHLRDVVWNSPYTIRPGVQVGVIPWDLEWHTHYDPPPFQAWVKLRGLPYAAWNDPDIRKVGIQLGKVTGIQPYGRQVGHFRYITVRIACEHPETIPKFAKYHEGVRSARVRVTLLHWRPFQEGPYPLPEVGWDNEPPQPPVQPQPPPQPPQQPNQPNDQHDDQQGANQSGTTEGDPNSSSSNASNSVNMVRREMKKLKWVCKIKPKFRQEWLQKKKDDVA